MPHGTEITPALKERRHFGEYLTGLLVAEKKNVTGINAEFAETIESLLEIPPTSGKAAPARKSVNRLESTTKSWLQPQLKAA